MTPSRRPPARSRGSALIVVILVMTFLVVGGISLLTVTATGPETAVNLRLQDEAFNAAEAGFDAAYSAISDYILNGAWSDFADHTLVEPTGIDVPYHDMFFRRKTDEELLGLLDANADGAPDAATGVVFFKQTFAKRPDGTLDPDRWYTVILVDNEAGGTAAVSADALMVCVGGIEKGGRLTTARLEVVIATE